MIEKKGLLLICPSFYPITGGSETFYMDFIKYFTRKEHKVFTVACGLKSGDLSGFKNKNLNLFYIPCLTPRIFNAISKNVMLYFLYIFPFLFISTLYALIKHNDEIDLVYSNSITAGAVGTILAKLFRKRSAIITHGAIVYENSQHARFKRFIISLYSLNNIIFSAGEKFRKEYISHGLLPKKLVNYTHWVDGELFKPLNKQKTRNDLSLKSEGFIVFYAGRLVEEKGINLILNVSKDPEMLKVIFIFAGDGNLKEDVMNASSKANNVKYLGRLDQDDLSLYYNAASVVIMPSLSNFESFNRTLIEALYCGTPIIASARGEMVSTVDPSVGILIEPTTNELKAAIQKMSKDLKYYEKLQEHCYQYSQEKFSNINAEIFLELDKV